MEYTKQAGVVNTEFAVLIHRLGYEKDSMWMALPIERMSLLPSILQSLADDIARDRSRSCNYSLKAVRNEDGSFTLQ